MISYDAGVDDELVDSTSLMEEMVAAVKTDPLKILRTLRLIAPCNASSLARVSFPARISSFCFNVKDSTETSVVSIFGQKLYLIGKLTWTDCWDNDFLRP